MSRVDDLRNAVNGSLNLLGENITKRNEIEEIETRDGYGRMTYISDTYRELLNQAEYLATVIPMMNNEIIEILSKDLQS